MEKIGFLKSIFKKKENITEAGCLQMLTVVGNSCYKWDGNLFKSDIIRACIRPKAKAIGKLLPKHIKYADGEIKINEEPRIRFLLEEPNPYMSGQMMLEKVATQLSLNNNAFILIIRDEMGSICQLFPVPAEYVEAEYVNQELFYKFIFTNGKNLTVPSTEVIHLREDFNSNDIFGESPAKALFDMINTIGSIDKSVVSAIKNGSVVRWLLKYNTSMRPDDIEENTKKFVDSYLNIDNSFGAAGIDQKADVQRIEPKDYVPNADLLDRFTSRVYAFFNTNEKIVNSNHTEDEWNSYFEAVIEPLALQLSNEYTRKIFTRKERVVGNKIHFEASNLQFASNKTKLNLVQMVDRGALTPNEWRNVFNLAPVEGGNVPIRRLDTAAVENTKEDEEYN